jgi:hypothetical protein
MLPESVCHCWFPRGVTLTDADQANADYLVLAWDITPKLNPAGTNYLVGAEQDWYKSGMHVHLSGEECSN